jgi:hypothetical protein
MSTAGMCRRVGLVRTDVSEEHVASNIWHYLPAFPLVFPLVVTNNVLRTSASFVMTPLMLLDRHSVPGEHRPPYHTGNSNMAAKR